MCIAGASITACRGTGRYIMALEDDKEIFNVLFKPMKKTYADLVTKELPAVSIFLPTLGKIAGTIRLLVSIVNFDLGA